MGEELHGDSLTADGNYNMLISDAKLDTDKGALSFIDAQYHGQRARKSRIERRWAENLDMYAGDHWPRTRLTEGETPVSGRVRYIANLLSAYVQTRKAKMLKVKPTVKVNPATNQVEDHDIAKTSTRVMKYLWACLKMNGHVLPRAIDWFLTTGFVGFKTVWDPQGGRYLKFTEEEMSSAKDVLEEHFGEEKAQLFEGEVRIEPVSGFWIYPDPSAESWEDLDWILDIRLRSLDWIRNRYPKRGRKVTDEGKDPRNYYETRGRYDDTTEFGIAGAHSGERIPAAYVKELWVKPCPTYPDGVHVIVAHERVLQPMQPLPPECKGELPYAFAVDKPIPGTLWPRAIYDDAKVIQKGFNRSRSQIIENANLAANPKILIPAGCRVEPDSLTNRPGEVIPYVSVQGQEPHYMQTPAMPDYLKNLPDQLQGDFMAITGHNEPTFRAAAPTNVRTSSGLSQLINEDDSRLSSQIETLNKALCDVGRFCLNSAAVNYDSPRMARVMGDRDKIESFSFTGKDLVGETGGADYADVEIMIDSGHRSKQAQQEFILNLVNMGLINRENEAERRWALRAMDAGTPDDDMFGSTPMAEAQARAENRWMAQMPDELYMDLIRMDMSGAKEWDDHDEHLKVHDEFMRTLDFFKLMEAEPERIQRFLVHRNEHRDMLAQKAMDDAAMAGLQGGGPGGQAPGSNSAPMSMSGTPEVGMDPNSTSPPGQVRRPSFDERGAGVGAL